MKIFKNRLLIGIIIISIILMTFIGVTRNGRLLPDPISGVIGKLVSPVEWVFQGIGGFFGNIGENIHSFRFQKEENTRMKKELESLKMENLKFNQVAIENVRLRETLQFKEANVDLTTIAAEVIGKDPGNWYEVFNINKGTKDGVNVNDAVIVGKGYIVGRIIEAGSNWSKFLALNDERSSVSVIVNRTRALGVVVGDNGDTVNAIMPYDADIIKGDELITSNYSTFPQGLFIGTVKDVIKDDKKLQKLINIDPAANLTKLEEVFVVKKK